MQLPYFFEENITQGSPLIELSPETSRHIVQVLRMQEGDQVLLTNGKGIQARAALASANKKKATVTVLDTTNHLARSRETAIAISILKNESRFEWFLEKATEIGIGRIIPILCNRTEKKTLRFERMKNILKSAMLQSRQVFLPELNNPVELNSFVAHEYYDQKFIAHCINSEHKIPFRDIQKKGTSQIILIGPEGDFTDEEIGGCLQNNFLPVSLGETRLRTETAGVVAAVLMSL